MERLLYNAALGALPLKTDETALYHSDCNETGKKVYFGERGLTGQLETGAILEGAEQFQRVAHTCGVPRHNH